MWRIEIINSTKIKYLSVADKIYKVTNIDFCNQAIEASGTDLSIVDVPESEVFPVEELGEFRIRLINGDGMDDLIKTVPLIIGCQRHWIGIFIVDAEVID